ncbi:hypothetical protein PAPYR_11103 [Paratrimastix pyriformis]|uniref:Uncharacterized protein n=1 Tax=Paratrimastix pyriformis TaxID=342808 RepID=A0ABQ8U8F1_9EUKA|nr:hypothetical protein PAPYR_11103 [Paratrimastix pyriformis]
MRTCGTSSKRIHVLRILLLPLTHPADQHGTVNSERNLALHIPGITDVPPTKAFIALVSIPAHCPPVLPFALGRDNPPGDGYYHGVSPLIGCSRVASPALDMPPPPPGALGAAPFSVAPHPATLDEPHPVGILGAHEAHQVGCCPAPKPPGMTGHRGHLVGRGGSDLAFPGRRPAFPRAGTHPAHPLG